MAIAHINHVRQSKLTEYILQNFKYSVAGIGEWEVSINSATIWCIRIYANSPNSSLPDAARILAVKQATRSIS
ncbi:MAG: hypothetical protein V7K43_27230 [Nostoc sp.]